MTRMMNALLAAALIVAIPGISEAGPPLLCHPFQTADASLLPWGDGDEWNSPDASYDVRRLPDDLQRLLTADAPVLARMENMRRAVIYALENPRLADQLIAALATRTVSATGREQALALFDAGYLLETYKQGVHRHHRTDVPDGYSMVLRAITMSGGNPEMELAASLMTQGERAQSHVRRARAAASAESLLAKNIETLWR
jgi:hypothetical protein